MQNEDIKSKVLYKVCENSEFHPPKIIFAAT